MILLWLLIGYVSTQCDIPHDIIDPECEGSLPENCSPARLFGGVDIKRERFPYLVSLQRSLGMLNPAWDLYYQHFCGATMIANRVVLTAAHCLWATETYDWRSAKGATGIPSTEIFAAIDPFCRHMKGKGRFRVEEYFVHPGYEGFPQTGNDIAVLVLEKGLDYQGVLADYKASSNISLNDLTNMTIIGWGFTETIERITFQRSVKPAQQGWVSFMEMGECTNLTTSVNATYIVDDNKMICGFNSGIDTCIADSGGPLLYLGPNGQLNQQVGITSWGPDSSCSNVRGSFPGVYTKLSNYVKWLDETLAQIQINYPELSNSIAAVLGIQTNGAITTSTNIGTDCVVQAEYGNGEASILSFYYDASTSQCVEFIWSGKGGNNNNFATLEDCQQTCNTSKK